MSSSAAQTRTANSRILLKQANVLSNGAAAYIVLALGIVLTAAAAIFMVRQVEHDASVNFQRSVADAEEAIEMRIRAYSDVLLGVRALFIASDGVSRDEFHSYVASLGLHRRYPGIQVIHYAQRLTAAQRPSFEAAVRADKSVAAQGYPDFAIKPPGERSEYVVVQYVEPMAGNENALGLDLGGDAVRLATLERTRDTGQLTASGSIVLADDPRRHAGFAMRLPVYRKGAPLATEEQRREAFNGIVSASFAVVDLMRGVLNEQFLRTIHVRVHDAGPMDSATGLQQPSANNLMFDSDRLHPDGSTASASPAALGNLSTYAAIDVGGRRWDLYFSARQGFIPASERMLPWMMLFGGMAISLMLFWLIRSLASSGQRAARLAKRAADDLRHSEASLADAQRMTQQLIEALPNPVYFKATDGHVLGVNRAWEQYFGRSRDTFIGKTVHDLYPENQEVADRLQALDRELWEQPGTQTFETRITTPNGQPRDTIFYKATFTRADGSVAGLVGTIIDITERKRLAQQFQATFEQAAVGIAHFDLEHRNIRVNRRYSEIVGYSPEELINQLPGFLNYPGDKGLGSEQRSQLLSGAIDAFSQEKRYIRKDGRVVWVTRTESLARDAAGVPQYFIRVIEDITERKEAAERYRATFDNAPVGIMHTALEHDRILHVNSKLCEMLGYTPDELTKLRTDQFVHPDQIGTDRPRYRERMLNGEIETYSSERIYRRKDGSDLWVDRTVSLARDASRKPLHFIRVVQDITERKQAEQRLAMEHAVSRVLAEAETLAAAIRKIVETICQTLGWHCGSRWATDETSGAMRCFECWGVDTAEIQEFIVSNSNRVMQSGGGSEIGLVRRACSTAKPVWIADLSQAKGFNRAALVAKANLHGAFCFPLLVGHEVLGVMEFFHRDVREPDAMLINAAESIGSQIGQYIVRQQAEERVRRLAHFDELTGLPNRTMFNERLCHAIATARRNQRSLVVLFIDLDRFKNINDTLGHDAGDSVLKEVAHRLRECLRESDTVGRLGGDEFVVLLEEPPGPINAAVVAQKIIAALCKPFLLHAQEFDMTASIGISSYPGDGTDPQTLMKNADIAMYRAKEQGKNNFQFYSAQFNVHSIERLTLESNLRRALERDEFVLYYQPKLDICTGRITGVEALVRWQSAQGLVAPAQFIQLAEETGLIVPIGEWVLKTACAQHSAWQSQGCDPVRIAVNLSPRQFSNENLLADIERLLEQTGLDPALLELEITEGVATHNPEQTVVLLNRLKAYGIRLAIDDFGTGYSSLSYLKRFPLDTLKIDRTFIRDLPGDADDAAITRAIIAMAHSLRLGVVAEGVETAEQLRFLRDQGCDEIQGYYFSKPLPAEEIAQLLRDHSSALTMSQQVRRLPKLANRSRIRSRR